MRLPDYRYAMIPCRCRSPRIGTGGSVGAASPATGAGRVLTEALSGQLVLATSAGTVPRPRALYMPKASHHPHNNRTVDADRRTVTCGGKSTTHSARCRAGTTLIHSIAASAADQVIHRLDAPLNGRRHSRPTSQRVAPFPSCLPASRKPGNRRRNGRLFGPASRRRRFSI